MLEILSPAGSFETVVAAVRSGCDAVYLGGKSFSARRNATNFDEDELIETVKYCHIRRVKVYVTVNILIKDSELNEAINFLSFLNKIGIDGVIVQDLGIAKIIKEQFPQLDMHGSTQMSISNKEALPLLKKMGFKRIVIAREMNKQQIAEFCQLAKKLDIEVEMFVHGALCMSVSGQCLLSAMIGQRSGNRGLCAQACRLPFKYKTGLGYDLSLKDSSLFKYVKELETIGITSLKIEGRMKRPEYVAMATKCCYDAINYEKYDDSLLKDVFSRSGFSDGYYLNRLGKDNFGIRTKEDVDASMNSFNKIHEIYRNERQSVGIDVKCIVKKDEPIKLICEDIIIEGDKPLEAINKPTDKKQIIDNLDKLGSTCYYLKSVEVEIEDHLFVRSSIVNDLRRQLCDKLARRDSYVPIRKENNYNYQNVAQSHSFKGYYLRLADINQLPEDLSEVLGVIVPIDQQLQLNDKEVIVEIPRYIKNEEYIIKRLQQLNAKKVYVNNLAAYQIAKNMHLEIMGGNFLNIFNSVENLELKQTTLSVELSLKEISNIKRQGEKGIIGYGYLPLMLLVNCPLKNEQECADCDKHGFLVDRTNTKFAVRCHLGVSELFNSKPIVLADKFDDIKNIDYMILYFTIENKQQVEEVMKAYKNHSNNLNDFTRGLYYRSVL